MIARHEAQLNRTDIWAALAAPLPADTIAWRQDGRSVLRDGRWYARFVAYVEANTVRERLDASVPGEWDLTLELLPPLGGDDPTAACAFKARLQILGVIREDVGTGRDYKAAATDAFKRAAVRFGVAHELYQLDANWVQVDGDGRNAKPLEDPQSAYDRRANRPATFAHGFESTMDLDVPNGSAHVALTSDDAACPKCGKRMWDNRLTKRNPKAPDFKCRDRSCDGVIWPPRPGSPSTPAPATPADEDPSEEMFDSSPLGGSYESEIPF